MWELVREDNTLLNQTFVYEYDNAGNITAKKTYALTAAGVTPSSPTATVTYTYSTSTWGDMLTSYNGITVTYDEIGNPLNYNNRTLSWTGRQLTGAVDGTCVMTFTYNDEGIRTSKTVDGVTTNYYLNGSQIVAEETNGNVTVYIYDGEGLPLGMRYHSASASATAWESYWFERNLHGDVVAVYSNTGTKLMSYTYDAWGSFTATTHVSGTNAGKNNLRYRGYYYDSDLTLYCVGTRYYDATNGRWINADSLMSGVNGGLEGFNLYVYCFNNPVMYADHSGHWPKWIKDVVRWTTNAYNTWKEESFVYNIVLSNITTDVGVGIGIGGSIELGSANISAISRVDIIGAKTTGTEISWGHFGKSAASIGIGKYSVGIESETYESFDGTIYSNTQNFPEVGWSIGGEIGFGIAIHASASISYTGMYENFISFGRRRQWWK